MADPVLLRSTYAAVLAQRLGLPVELDADDVEELSFQHMGFKFLLTTGGSADPSFVVVRLIFHAQALDGGAGVDRAVVARVAEQVSRQMKVAKVFVTSENLVIMSCELLVSAPSTLPTPETLLAVVPRSLKILAASAQEMHEQLQLHGIAEASNAAERTVD